MDLRIKLSKCTELLLEYHKLVDTCMVSFINEDLFQLIPEELSVELLSLSDDELANLPSLLFSDESISMLEGKPVIASTINRIKSLLLDNLFTETNEKLNLKSRKEPGPGFQHFDKIMPEKKTHEVEIMSDCVNNLCEDNDAHFLVDLGSGKAYLSQVMVFFHKKRILAIDSEEVNTKGADTWQKNLTKKWNTLELRAQERKEGKSASSRKQRFKAANAVKKEGGKAAIEKDIIDVPNNDDSKDIIDVPNNDDSKDISDVPNNDNSKDTIDVPNNDDSKDIIDVPNNDNSKDTIDVPNNDNSKDIIDVPNNDDSKDIIDVPNNDNSKDTIDIPNNDNSKDTIDVPNADDTKDKIPALVNENIKLSTKFVADDTDLGEIIEAEYTDYSQRMGIMGLHTCGNLASSSIKIFFATKSAKFLCNVGCCYHGLEEEFYRNPYLKADEKPALSPVFPMSSMLRETRFWLGRNARILASQPLGRLADNKNLPSHSLLWRAILQVMLLQVLPTLSFHDQQVGRIATKSADFVDYVHRAFKKLKLELTFSDEQILEFYNKYKPLYHQKLNCFYQLRSLFAPIIEGIILLDRLLYISDNSNTTSCSVIRLFEPAISPRCYALIASKA